MTRSLANCSAEGGTIDNPGGGRFLDEDPDGLPKGLLISDSFCPSGASPLAVFNSLDSIIDRCCSRTDRLRWMCSRMVGSWVWKPGERTAIPASCIPIPSLAVSGVADGLDESPAGAAAMLVERSSLRGRCRELLGRDGDEGGSFFTMILGAFPELRVLEHVRQIQRVVRMALLNDLRFGRSPSLRWGPLSILIAGGGPSLGTGGI